MTSQSESCDAWELCDRKQNLQWQTIIVLQQTQSFMETKKQEDSPQNGNIINCKETWRDLQLSQTYVRKYKMRKQDSVQKRNILTHSVSRILTYPHKKHNGVDAVKIWRHQCIHRSVEITTLVSQEEETVQTRNLENQRLWSHREMINENRHTNYQLEKGKR